MKKNHQGAIDIFNTIGIYLGYGIAYYAKFYDIKHVLILGRVTSSIGGELIIRMTKEVLEKEFFELSKKINIQLPDEKIKKSWTVDCGCKS